MKKEKLEDITPFVPHFVFEESKANETTKKIARNKKAKREHIKECILASIVLVFIVLVTVFIIKHTENMFANGLSSCLNDGNSQVYCETHNVR